MNNRLSLLFQNEIEIGMNLYYDLWNELLNYYSDYSKIMIQTYRINEKNISISKLYNEIIERDLKDDKLNDVFEGYLRNYMNDSKAALKISTRAKSKKRSMTKNILFFKYSF